MGSDSDGDDYEPCQLLAVATAPFAKHRDTHCYDYSYLSRTRTAAVCEMSLFMHEIVGGEEEDNPPRVKRTRRVFPRPTYKGSYVCALIYSGAANPCEYVRGRAIAVVDYYSRELCSKNNLQSRASLWVFDQILPASFCRPKIMLFFCFGRIFCFGYASTGV